MSLVTLFVTTLPKTPSGLLRALWLSFASLFDPGQGPEVIGPGARVAVLGYLFFIIVRAPGNTITRCSPLVVSRLASDGLLKDVVADYDELIHRQPLCRVDLIWNCLPRACDSGGALPHDCLPPVVFAI